MDLTEMPPPVPDGSTRLRQRLNDRRRAEFVALIRADPPKVPWKKEEPRRNAPRKTSRYPGVRWMPKGDQWEAWGMIANQRVTFGVYDTEIEAARARDRAILAQNPNAATVAPPELE
jgi:hypothetical protein